METAESVKQHLLLLSNRPIVLVRKGQGGGQRRCPAGTRIQYRLIPNHTTPERCARSAPDNFQVASSRPGAAPPARDRRTAATGETPPALGRARSTARREHPREPRHDRAAHAACRRSRRYRWIDSPPFRHAKPPHPQPSSAARREPYVNEYWPRPTPCLTLQPCASLLRCGKTGGPSSVGIRLIGTRDAPRHTQANARRLSRPQEPAKMLAQVIHNVRPVRAARQR